MSSLKRRPLGFASLDAIDLVTMDVPLLIRLLELAREDIKSDVELHEVVTKIIEVSKEKDILNIDDYHSFLPGKGPSVASVSDDEFLKYKNLAVKGLLSLGGEATPNTGLSDVVFPQAEAMPLSRKLPQIGFMARGGSAWVHQSWPLSLRVTLGGGRVNVRVLKGPV